MMHNGPWWLFTKTTTRTELNNEPHRKPSTYTKLTTTPPPPGRHENTHTPHTQSTQTTTPQKIQRNKNTHRNTPTTRCKEKL